MEAAGAYGAAKAGSVAFDPVAFFTHPRTVLRLTSWVFSMVVFSCIVNEGYINIGSERLLCVFNNNADACLACFLWFVGFCFLANQWQATSPDELPLAQGSDAARATITFCFFSILTWVNTNLFTWQHLDPPTGGARATPYPIANGATIVTTNPYQAPPFTETLDPQKLTQQRPVAPAF
ncbi:Synaptogyrin-3 [Liparis tanakae]|uniref:Synaptogyrin-3 n=1 Tax=Liparis tanakae TaxID=230148 RepID=A0A4Z2ERP0_9TELE|nr:Synaptogyrin-3 [Liparis tanakae]